MDPAAIERNPQALPSMSPDRPDPVLASDRALRQSTGERDWRPTWRHLVPIVVPVPASQSSRTWRHLCWLSPSASSLMRQADAGATMTQFAEWAWHPGHTPAFQSALHNPHRRHVPARPAAGAGLAACPRLGDIPCGVQPAGAALQHCRQEAAAT